MFEFLNSPCFVVRVRCKVVKGGGLFIYGS